MHEINRNIFRSPLRGRAEGNGDRDDRCRTDNEHAGCVEQFFWAFCWASNPCLFIQESINCRITARRPRFNTYFPRKKYDTYPSNLQYYQR